MKLKVISIAVIAALAGTVAILSVLYSRERERKEAYRQTSYSLLDTVRTYRIRDSINVAEKGALRLSLSEFEKYRREDAELVRELKDRNGDLERLVGIQSETIQDLQVKVRDTVIVRDSMAYVLPRIRYSDRWFSLDGYIEDSVFHGRRISYEELKVVERVRYGRFLWFRCRKRIKERKVNVLSLNPYTEIRNVEYVTIEE